MGRGGRAIFHVDLLPERQVDGHARDDVGGTGAAWRRPIRRRRCSRATRLAPERRSRAEADDVAEAKGKDLPD